MLTLEHAGRRYRINFVYDKDDSNHRTTERTTCIIYDTTNDEKVVIAKNSARKSHLDKFFDKNEGRKHALENVLTLTNFDKDFRKEIWKKYFEMRHNKY